jgi:hypothetical protein
MNQMKIHKTYIAAGMIIALALFLELAAHADDNLQETEITFNQPVQIPGQILPAGTYLFKQINGENLDIVQIFSSDRGHVYATLQTIPTQRREVADDTTVTLAAQGSGKPIVLLKWFYPGEDTGHQFTYSGEFEKQLAQDQQQNVVANQRPTTDSEASVSN